MTQTKKNLIVVNLLKKADYNTKISETENKIPSISGLATTSALTAVENKYVMLVISSKKKKKKKKKQIMTQKY